MPSEAELVQWGGRAAASSEGQHSALVLLHQEGALCRRQKNPICAISFEELNL